MLGLIKICAKLNICFYCFLGDRLAVPGTPTVPSLPGPVIQAAARTPVNLECVLGVDRSGLRN